MLLFGKKFRTHFLRVSMKDLEKVLAVVKKTGDRVIVVSEYDSPIVVMTLGDYENLIEDKTSIQSLTEDELLDKINRDIAVWRQMQEEAGWDEFEPIIPEDEDVSTDDDRVYLEPVE